MTKWTRIFLLYLLSFSYGAEFNKKLPTLSISYKKFAEEQILEVDEYGPDVYIENSTGFVHEDTFLDIPMVVKFMMYNCRFASFDWSSLFRMSYLDSIDVYDVRGLGELTNSVMLGFKGLRSLSIYDADVAFRNDTFQRLKHLEYLSISKVDVAVLGSDVFAGSRIKELYWTQSGIARIHKNCFASLKYVEIINLSGNKLEHLEPDTFAGLKRLERLYLNRNKLATIGFRHFANLPGLRYLDVSRNLVAMLNVQEILDGVPGLEKIIMDKRSYPPGLKKDALRNLDVMLV